MLHFLWGFFITIILGYNFFNKEFYYITLPVVAIGSIVLTIFENKWKEAFGENNDSK